MSEESSPQPREIAEQRGDFMLLPPMTPTFGVPAMLQQSPADFLVTRRPTAVTSGGLAHAVDASLLGRFSGRARKARGRRRAASAELDHLLTPAEVEGDVEQSEDFATVPAPPRPRTLQSTTATTRDSSTKRAAASTMPSRAEVRRAVSAPMPSSRAEVGGTTEPEVDFEAALAELPPSTFPSVGQSSPVVRRRRGVEAPAPSAGEPAAEPAAPIIEPIVEPPAVDLVIPKDASALPAIRRRQPRGRVHQPPEELLASTMPDAPALSSARRTEDLSVPGIEAPDSLTPAPETARSTQAAATPIEAPPSISATPSSATPSPTSNEDAPSVRQSDTSVDSSTQASPAAANLAPSQESRPTLGSEAASGLSGIQRRARDSFGPASAGQSPAGQTSVAQTSTDTAPTATAPTATSSTASTMSAGSASQSDTSGVQRRGRDADEASASSSTDPLRASAPDSPSPTPPTSVAQPTSTLLTAPSVDRSPTTQAMSTGRVSPGAELGPQSGPASGPEVPMTAVTPSPSNTDAVQPVASNTETTRTRPLASENPLEGSSATVRSTAVEPADDDGITAPDITSAPIASDVPAPLPPLQGPGKASATSALDVSSGSASASSAHTSTDGVPSSEVVATPVASSSRSAPSAPAATSRPILASSGRTGIQRRERDQGATPRLAELGALPEPRVQGPRRIAVPESVRQVLRESVGEPPAHVTVHEGGAAAAQTDSVNAEAFTRDGQIYFAGDAPVDSERGQQLLAHELTHVMQQQGRAGSMPGEHTSEGKNLEQAARRVENQMASGRSETVRQVVRPTPSQSAEVEPLHHRTGSSTSSAIAGIVSPGPTSQASATSFGGSGASGMSPSHGGDGGIQRKAREPSRGMLDGVGGTASRAWSKSKETLLGQLEQEFSGPPASNKEPDSRDKQLERQASDLYPYLRRRLRAELVHDLERRGRL